MTHDKIAFIPTQEQLVALERIADAAVKGDMFPKWLRREIPHAYYQNGELKASVRFSPDATKNAILTYLLSCPWHDANPIGFLIDAIHAETVENEKRKKESADPFADKELAERGKPAEPNFADMKPLPKKRSKANAEKLHLSHCYQGENPNTCKYGTDDTCPAKPKGDK